MKQLLCLLSLLVWTTSAAAQMTCAEPSKQFTTEVEGEIKATAEGMKRIFEAQGAAQGRTKVVELIQKLPDANRTLLQRDLISATCELVKNSQGVEFDKKARLLIDLTKEIQSAFAKPSVTLNVIGENIIVASSLPAPQVDYALVMISEASVYLKCEVRGESVSAGDPLPFRKFYTFSKDELVISPLAAHNPNLATGNFLFKIPKRMLFEPVDSARSGLAYFGTLPSANCYDNDVKLYVGVWQRDTNEFLAVYKIQSTTAYGLCRAFISNVDASEFQNYGRRYQQFLQNEGQDTLKRNYVFAAKSDAFANVERSKTTEVTRDRLPPNVQALPVTIALDKAHVPCTATPLATAIQYS
jgi:hypothetical protein